MNRILGAINTNKIIGGREEFRRIFELYSYTSV